MGRERMKDEISHGVGREMFVFKIPTTLLMTKALKVDLGTQGLILEE